MSSITEMRRAALGARRNLTPSQRRIASQAACRRLARLPEVRRARRVGLYWPLASEIDPRPLLDHLPRHALACFPRVVGNVVRFVVCHPGQTRWRSSTLGVHEPTGQSFAINGLDVLVMPLAGFDAKADRIGLGGGFYDRSLATLRASPYRSPRRIGLAFEVQRLAHITPRDWDVPLQSVVTERAVYRPSTLD